MWYCPCPGPAEFLPHVLRPEPGSLSEKVSHLEAMLRKLQEDLKKVRGWPGALEESHEERVSC